MKHADWIREHLCDVHFQSNGWTNGWTVKTWVGFVDAFITTEHEGKLPPDMDAVVDAIQAQLRR